MDKNLLDQAAAKQRDLKNLNEMIEKDTRELQLLEMILKEVDRAMDELLNTYPKDFKNGLKTWSRTRLKALYNDMNDAKGGIMKEGFWVLFWMEYGRGHTVRKETYVFLKYKDGYSEDKEDLRSLAENWCQYDKQGCDLDRYNYGFEIVPKPPNTWLEEELKKLRSKHEEIIRQENLIKSELCGLDPTTTPYIGFLNESLKDAEEIKAGGKAPCPKCGELVLVEESNPPMLQFITHCGGSWLVGVDGKYVGNRHPDVSGKI